MIPRILFICLHNPFDNAGGAEQRTALLFQSLCNIGFVDIVCFADEPPPPKKEGARYKIGFWGSVRKTGHTRWQIVIRKLRFWGPYAAYFKDPACEEIINKLQQENNYHYTVIRYLEAAFLCGMAWRRDLIIDVDDLPWQRLKTFWTDASLPWRTRVFHAYDYLLARIHLPLLMKRSKHLFFSNAGQANRPNASHLPNMPLHRARTASPEIKTNTNHILFVGTLSYLPNWMGVNRFIKNIWGTVRTCLPEVRFIVVGKGAPCELVRQWQDVPGVELAGFLPDIEPVYASCSVVVAPIYHGAGTNIKVLEAMAMGKACVTTSFGSRGLEPHLQHQENIMIARNDVQFAEFVINLLTDHALNRHLGYSAHQTIINNYSVDNFQRMVTLAFN